MFRRALPLAVFLMLLAVVAIVGSYPARDLEGANRITESGERVIDAIERYHKDRHVLPQRLGDLVPAYLSDLPVVELRGEERPWRYRLQDDGTYELFATTMHFVSSYDAVVYRSDRSCPSWWKDLARVSEVNGWLYVVGFQAIERRRRNAALPEDVELLRDVTFGTGGGRSLKMHIVRPKKLGDKPLPVFVWIHGGGWRRGAKEAGVFRLVRYARLGFVGATIEYRLTGEASFPAQIEDCKCAIRFLRAHAKKYHIDPKRIAVGGSSAGGHLAALLGTSGDVKELEGSGGWRDQSSRVQAVIDLYGPTDLTEFVKTPGYESHARPNSPEAMLLGGPVLKHPDRAKRANPITYVDASDPPFLIMHGSKDRVVPVNQSQRLHEALKRASVPSRLHIIEGAGHGGREFFDPKIRAMEEAFLKRTLRPDR